MKRKRRREIGIVSDLHAGSRWGMLGPRSAYGKQNVGQQYLWRCWQQLGREWPRLDVLVLNGDIIDGKQYRSGATGLVTADLGEQTEIAIECVRALVDATRPRAIVRTVGTPYHESHDSVLGALDATFEIEVVDIVINLALEDGIVANIKHAPEGGGGVYIGSGMDRETLWACLAEAQHNIPRASWLIRSHLHMYARFDGSGKTIVVTPSWQLQAAYAQHKRAYRWIPMIGAVRLSHDPLHDHRYHLCKRTFPVPACKAVNIDAE